MAMSNNETKTINIEVEGRSKKTKEDAVQNAFSSLQKKVRSQIDGLIYYMKPVDVEVIEMKEENRIEKFLFFFFPKERKQYYVRLAIHIEISILHL